MKPFETLARARTAEGSALTLHRRGGDYFIYLDGEELMSTRRNHSEAALATLAWRQLGRVERPAVLIGGLGLGYTLCAALELLPPAGRLVVAELFPVVVDWNREYREESSAALRDRRVQLVAADVGAVIATSVDRFDAILLDVDNGPAAWCLESNARLYGRRGLAAVRRALRPHGVLAIWSAFPDRSFLKLLRSNGFTPRVESVRARGDKGARHTIFLATLASSGIGLRRS